MNPSPTKVLPAIRRLRIRRFRGIRFLEWLPDPTLNVLVGPADSCKSTVLEALSLLLTAAPNITLNEFDYFERKTGDQFDVEAVVAIDTAAFFREQEPPHSPLQGWLGDHLTELPDDEGSEPVLVCRLTGNADLEARWEIVGAGDEIRIPLPRRMREQIGLLKLWVGDRGDRDLRLVQGGALDRFLNGRAVRQAVVQTVMQTKVNDRLGPEPTKALKDIDKEFRQNSLPNPVRLGLVGIPGVSLAASVGLTIGASDETALPLVSWGSGTRRLSALELAGFGQSKHSIAAIDEPETGLEPYRQRAFMSALCASKSRQAFITTHSPAVISSSLRINGTLWRLNAQAHPDSGQSVDSQKRTSQYENQPSHALAALRDGEVFRLAQVHPESVVARVPVVCEGCTEVGFASKLLVERIGTTYDSTGLFLLDAGGHYKSLPICKELLAMGYAVAAVVDDEGKKGGAWADVGRDAVVLRWQDGMCLERAVVSALADEQLLALPEWVESLLGRRAVHQTADIRRELGVTEKRTAQELFDQVGRAKYLEAVCAAACPKPDGHSKPRGWFKSFDGGYFLAQKLFESQPPPALLQQIGDFVTKLEKLVST